MTANQAPLSMLPRESVRSVLIEMVFCPDGPDATADSQRRGLAYGSAFLYHLDGSHYLVTARHNLTGRHWQTDGCIGGYPVPPTHINVTFIAPPPTEKGWEFKPLANAPGRAEAALKLGRYLLPLIGEDWRPVWLEHPVLGKEMDVAVLSLDRVPADTFLASWNETVVTDPAQAISWPRLSAGTDIFVVGYPFGLTTGPLLPLWLRPS